MLVVALRDEIGSGKSSTLQRLGTELAGRIDGFIAVGGVRDDHTRGAREYRLQRVSNGETVPFATRTDVGYDIHPDARKTIEQWTSDFASEVFVIDEFGKWELEENGHWWLWEEMRIRKPRIVVVAVQSRVFDALEKKMGGFDLVIHSGEEQKVLQAYKQLKDWERLALGSGIATGLENTIGTWMHSIRFPLVGTVMPSLQAATMERVGRKLDDRSLLIWLPFITSASKSWAPSPTRFNTLIAISMQGWMFVAVHRALGWNRLSYFLSAALMGSWAAMQWFVIQYLVLGQELSRGYSLLQNVLGFRSLQLSHFVFGITITNGVVVAISALLLSGKLTVESASKYKLANRTSGKVTFWIPTIVILALMVVTQRSTSQVIQFLIQVLGVCAFFWALSVLVRQDRVRRFFMKGMGWGPSFLLRKTLQNSIP